LFNIWRKSGTEASYIERDIDEDPFCWKEKDDYPRRRACAQQAFSMHLVWRNVSASLSEVRLLIT
jgi:hypothetical protein